jgi:FkbM family methyltransferase
MNLRRAFKKSVDCLHILKARALPSYSQVGEDIIVNYLFNSLKIAKLSYLDIGVNHPVISNNTYFFYNRGSRGVCVEPDPHLFNIVKETRKNDVVLNCGIGFEESGSSAFYAFPKEYSGWNTFSLAEAKIRENESGIKIQNTSLVQLRSINNIIAENFKTYPNYISIDVEGLDLEILQSFDFEKYKPEIFCVETLTFNVDHKGAKIVGIIDFMRTKGYFAYADTYVNTIFCREDLFKTIAS